MKKFYTTLSGIAFFVVFIMVPGLVQADVFMKQKQHTDAFEMMGKTQPASDIIQTIWIAKDKMRTDNEQQSVIVRVDKGVMYFLDHAKKIYNEMPMDFSEAFGEKDMDDEDKAQFKKFTQGMMKMEISVTQTDEKKKINKWKCRKYIQNVEMFMGPMVSEIWATQDLKMDEGLQTQFLTGMMASMPGMQDSIKKAEQEMRKIKGVPVLTNVTTTVMNKTMKSSQELLEFKEGKAPKGIFDLPKGYKKRSM